MIFSASILLAVFLSQKLSISFFHIFQLGKKKIPDGIAVMLNMNR